MRSALLDLCGMAADDSRAQVTVLTARSFFAASSKVALSPSSVFSRISSPSPRTKSPFFKNPTTTPM